MADKRAERIAELIKPLRVKPGSTVNLAKDFDPGYKAGYVTKKDAAEIMRRGIAMLCDYQARLAAQDTHGVLVCLQALDAAGKDGTIRHVMSGVNPQGVHVTSFKVPSAEELDHDYLWRFNRHLPARGDIGIFNRSHYEEVLVVRVHPENLSRQKLPERAKRQGVWQRRYRERKRWDDYQEAYSEMLSATSTAWAPWYVIPADHKWFARLCAAAILVDTLMSIEPRYPEVSEERGRELLLIRSELEAQAPKGAAVDPFAAEQAAKQAKAGKQAKAKAGEKA
jgi:polyphosphate kinase 2 (PPK2 family)